MSCSHEHTTLRKKRVMQGRTRFGHQCNACRVRVGRWLSWDQVENPREVPWWLPPLSKPSQNSKAKTYRAYLRSSAWRRKREQRLEIDEYRCQFEVGPNEICASEDELEVHHKTYERFGNENVQTDLVTHCGEHHRFVTERDRYEAVMGTA